MSEQANTEQGVRIRICECCERERQLGEAGWEATIHGDFCRECIADLRAATDQLIDALPQRIGLCPQCAPEFYYPLKDGEGLVCPTMDCGLTMVVYTKAARA